MAALHLSGTSSSELSAISATVRSGPALIRDDSPVRNTKSHRRHSASFLLRVAPVFEGGKGDRWMSDAESKNGGSLSSAISNGAVRLLQEYTGRGPTKARTSIDRDSVMVLFGDTLTKGEKKLADVGDGAAVLEMRHRFQQAMREDLIALVESHMERKVVAFMSANHIDPDVGAEVFVLEPVA
jgi:uncharacterized protein YbcI